MKNRFSGFWKTFWKKGDFFTRLSLVVMGSGCFRFGQIVKGLLYLGAEALYFWFFFGFGWKYLSHFGTLGENTQLRVWDEANQIYKRVPGDNSMLILLYSVLTLAVTAIFLYVWFLNLKSTVKLLRLREEGKPVPKFREERKTLLDERFHVTLLTAPMTTLLLFTVLPIIFMVLIAFTNFDASHQPPGKLFTWTGLTNVTDIFLGNAIKTHTFFHILAWTMVWAVLATFTNYILGMLLAVVINHRAVRLKKLWRTLFIISIAIPQFVSLLLISRALEPQGAVNVALMELGWIQSPLPFLQDPTLARDLRGGHQYVDRHSLYHDGLQRRSDEYSLRPVRKRRDRRRGAGAQVRQHHAALYDLRHRARHHYHLCGQYQQFQRHLSADGGRALRAGLLSGGQDRPAGHVAV